MISPKHHYPLQALLNNSCKCPSQTNDTRSLTAGTNPEQLFAANWSACFDGALGLAARKFKVELPADVAFDAEVDLCLEGDAYFLRARLNVIQSMRITACGLQVVVFFSAFESRVVEWSIIRMFLQDFTQH